MFSLRVEDTNDLDPGSHLFLWIKITQILRAGWIVFIQLLSERMPAVGASLYSSSECPMLLRKGGAPFGSGSRVSRQLAS